MYVSRALRLEQCLCSPACGAAVVQYKAWLAGDRRWQTGDASPPRTAVPTDPFADQLRQSQEQEVLQLLSQRQAREVFKEDSKNVSWAVESLDSKLQTRGATCH